MSIEWRETCVRCGGFLPEGARISQEHCSKECYMEGYRELERQAVMEARAARPPCATCGGPIPMTRDMRAIYCSRECSRRAHVKTCPHCRKEFRGEADQVHCSWFCHCQTARRLHRAKPCDWCGVVITRPHRDTRFCSHRCAGKAGMDLRLTAGGSLPLLNPVRLDKLLAGA